MSIDAQQLSRNAQARFNHQASKRYLQEKYQNKLTFASQSGMWTASPELLAFLKLFTNQVVIRDVYNNPVKVHAPTLFKEMLELYTNTMNEWHGEYTELLNQL
jgi:hypothetical protein